jgi:hypothetical protein
MQTGGVGKSLIMVVDIRLIEVSIGSINGRDVISAESFDETILMGAI